MRKKKSPNAITKKPVKKTPKKTPKKARVPKEPKPRNGGKWSTAQFWQSIRSALRSKSRFWYPRTQCMEKARRPSEAKNRRLKWEFQCNRCLGWFPQTQVEAHHSIPAGKLNGYEDVAGFIERLFAETGWECLCRECHKQSHKDEKEAA